MGIFANIVAVVGGGILGLLLKSGLPERFRIVIFSGLGLMLAVIGIQMSLEVTNLIVVMFSLIIGGVFGEVLNIEDGFDNLGEKLKKKIKIGGTEKLGEGLVMAFLATCVGPLAIMGPLNEGLSGDHTLLFTKSALDFFTFIALGSAFGFSVLLTVIPMIIFQILLVLFASQIKGFVTDDMLSQLTALGGVLIMGISWNVLGGKKVKVSNFLPGLIIVVIFSLIFG